MLQSRLQFAQLSLATDERTSGLGAWSKDSVWLGLRLDHTLIPTAGYTVWYFQTKAIVLMALHRGKLCFSAVKTARTKLLSGAGLADALIPHHHDQPPQAGQGMLQSRLQFAQLSLATDERTSGLGAWSKDSVWLGLRLDHTLIPTAGYTVWYFQTKAIVLMALHRGKLCFSAVKTARTKL